MAHLSIEYSSMEKKTMKKYLLDGKWRMTGNGYDVEGKIPGSVYCRNLEETAAYLREIAQFTISGTSKFSIEA